MRGTFEGDVQGIAEELRAAHAGQGVDDRPGGARARQADFEQLAVESGGERAWRVEGEQPALVQEGEAVEAFGFVEIGGRNHGGDPATDHLVHDPPEVAARHRIDAEGRLVEQQHARLVDQGAGEAELLLHAAGERAGQPVAERREIGEGEQALAARRAFGARHSEEVGVELEILVDREVGVEPETLRHVGEPGLDGLGVAHDGDAVEDGVAGARLEDPSEHAQRGGLAGAVGTDEAEELAGADLEIEAGDRQPLGGCARLAETARQAAHRDRGRGLRRCCGRHGVSTSLTSAGRPGLSSSPGSPVTRTFTA